MGARRHDEEARELAELLGYPVLVRPSYVLGGRGMRVARTPAELELGAPALVDRFLEGALELDVDILCDGEDGWVAAIIEHVERAGVHSGDSACVLPAPSVGSTLEAEIRTLAATLARGLGARGLLNLQLALHEGELYVLEANPRASRTSRSSRRRPGSRSSTTPAACSSARRSPSSACRSVVPDRAWAKEAIFPSERFAGAADRGVEMRSTGEVMTSGATPAAAYRRALQAAGRGRATSGNRRSTRVRKGHAGARTRRVPRRRAGGPVMSV